MARYWFAGSPVNLKLVLTCLAIDQEGDGGSGGRVEDEERERGGVSKKNQ
jgi:hypothetical protein